MTSGDRLGRLPGTAAALALALLLPFLASCSGAQEQPASRQLVPTSQQVPRASAINGKRVVAISLDGLNPRAITRLGRSRLPHLYRMIREGAYTLNARAQVEQTVTLPNHTSMVTGRRIRAAADGHGVTWNTHRPGTTVHGAAGHDVSSVFRTVHRGGGRTALFSTKQKFTLFGRSWSQAVHRTVIRDADDVALTRLFRRDIVATKRAFAFLHLGLADKTGHARGWMTRPYLDAVVRLDRLVGQVLSTVRSTPRLARSTVVVLTADHGGVPGTNGHGAATSFENYRVPFIVWGAGVDHGDLYDLNPTLRNPGRGRPGVSGAQPVRNGDLANLATKVLGLGPVAGSLWNRSQHLTWHR